MNAEQTTTVVYIITKLELGGAQKVCLSLFHGLPTTTMRSYLITGAEGVLVESVINNPHVILLDSFKREVSFKFLFKEIKSFFTLIKTIRTLKKKHPHVIVHTHSTKAGIIGRWAAFFARVPRVHTIHGFAFHEQQPMLQWLICYIPELITSFITTHFVCVSSADVQTGVKLFPRFAQKHTIIRAAVESKPFLAAQRTTDFPAETFVFGTIACFKPQKNLFDLLQAFAYVHAKNPHTRLEIIGDGVLRPQIEQWIAERNLQAVITLHGWQQSVAPFMLNWHAFVLSSLWEGLPCAIIEARLLQLPVIAYNTGGIKDVIQHGKNGFLCKQQWQDLAQEMLNLSLNTHLYAALQAYPDDLEQFHADYMIERHAKLYKNLL